MPTAKYTTPEDVILRMRTALESADRKLELILGSTDRAEFGFAGTVALNVRRIIRSGLRDCGIDVTPEERPGRILDKPTTVELRKWKKLV